MMVSSKGRYALRVMLELAQRPAGSYTPLLADDEKSLFAFARGNREEELLAVFNLGERAQTWDCAGESVHVLPHSVHILFRPVQKEEKPCVQKPSWRSSPA